MQQQQQHQQRQQQQQQKPVHAQGSVQETQQMLQDVLAGSIKSQQDQFADLHNRIQIINHRVNSISDLLERMETENTQRFNQLMERVVPIDDRSAAMLRNMEKVERINMEIQRDLESKDFKDMLNQVHNAIQNSHSGLSASMPEAIEQSKSSLFQTLFGESLITTVVEYHKHSMTTFLFIAVAVQVMVVGAYMVYKKRRNGAPKKYL